MADNDYNSGEDFNSIFDGSGSVSRGEVQRVVKDEVQKTLRDIGTFSAQAQAAVSNAIREVTAVHPDFQERRSRMLATLEEIPLLRDAIGAAEANPQLAPTLPAMYEILWRASQAPAGSNATATSATSEPSKLESQDLSDESTQYRAALASQRVDLSPANRKALITELEKRGVGDIEF